MRYLAAFLGAVLVPTAMPSLMAAESLGVGPGELRIQVPPRSSPAVSRAAQLFAERVEARTGLLIPVVEAEGGPRPRIRLILSTRDTLAAGLLAPPVEARLEALGPDGFALLTVPDPAGRILVVGSTPGGVVAGVGHLLRSLTFGDHRVEIPSAARFDVPGMPVRGIYFATHFHNFYHDAPLDEVDRVIEECALWGTNSLIAWFDMHHFRSFQEPAAQEHVRRLGHFSRTATGLGMKFGLVFIANEAYADSPPELRARYQPTWSHYHVELCPSNPQGLALSARWQAEVIDAFPKVDQVWSWPYDQGGCACARCAPWGCTGYLKASEQLAAIYHRRFAQGEFWISTWLFDCTGTDGRLTPDHLSSGLEYPGLSRWLGERQPPWLTGIIMGTHGDWVPTPLLSRPLPRRYPLACFPEISMRGMDPWGGFGANPMPGACAQLASRLADQVIGGWPYSEGIYEDLNKFYWARFFWNPGLTPNDIVSEYVRYYLGPRAGADGLRLVNLLEASLPHRGWDAPSLGGADDAWILAQRIDGRLDAWAKSSWRWRLLYVRSAIDAILKSQGHTSEAARAALDPLFGELVRIYHAERSFIRPPLLTAPPRGDRPNLARGRPVEVSSSHPDLPGCRRALVDGITAEQDSQNFWAHDASKGPTARITIDLGKIMSIEQVRLQFRGINGAFWFVPSRITPTVSMDGSHFEPADPFTRLPVEGSPYSPAFWACPVGKFGRYLRIDLGPSQHTGEPFPDLLELTEIEILGQ